MAKTFRCLAAVPAAEAETVAPVRTATRTNILWDNLTRGCVAPLTRGCVAPLTRGDVALPRVGGVALLTGDVIRLVSTLLIASTCNQ